MKRSDVTTGTPRRACSLDTLVTVTGAPAKVADAAMRRAAARGLVGWGVSLRTAWPTDKGSRLLTTECVTTGRVRWWIYG